MFNPKNQSVMKFTAQSILNLHGEMEKALTISQIKEFLLYLESIKRSVRDSFKESLGDCEEGSDDYLANLRMIERYKCEAQTLHQLAVSIEEYIS